MHLDGTHLLGKVLARPLYQSFAEVGGKLSPRIGREVHTAACGSTHSCDNLLRGTALHRAGDEYPSLSVRIVHRQLHGDDVPVIFQRRDEYAQAFRFLSVCFPT